MDGNVVAIKTFKRPHTLGGEQRTHDQLLLASKLQHQNIVKVLGYGHEVETQKSSMIMRLLKHNPAKETIFGLKNTCRMEQCYPKR
jgi:L1 cell adhesion molecule like protein